MAELLVAVVDVCAGKAGEDMEGFTKSSWLVRFNTLLLVFGKFVDVIELRPVAVVPLDRRRRLAPRHPVHCQAAFAY